MSLSLCTIVWNEEALLGGMLESTLGLVDEYVLGIDSRTDDYTRVVASGVEARLVPFVWQDNFAEARNRILERARGDWILALDADERLMPHTLRTLADLLADEIPLRVDGFRMLLLEGDSQEWTAPRLFRNAPDLRYVGRVHEEIRYLPDPPRTMSVKLDDGPHLVHLGRGHQERDRRLLHLRLRDNPNDAVAYCYLALMARKAGRPLAARTFARRALGCGPRTLHAERVAELENFSR